MVTYNVGLCVLALHVVHIKYVAIIVILVLSYYGIEVSWGAEVCKYVIWLLVWRWIDENVFQEYSL